MPNIKEYTSPIDKLTPDERGFTAWETTGRRIGPLYNQAAADIERGGKLDVQAIDQAEKLNTHELDYLGLLNAQKARASGGGHGGGGGGSSGGSHQPTPQTYNPGPSFANAAAQMTGAAAAVVSTGHQEGRGLYAPPDPLQGNYYDPAAFQKIINDQTGTSAEDQQQQEMDRLDAQNPAPTKGNYTTDQFNTMLGTLAPDKSSGFFSDPLGWIGNYWNSMTSGGSTNPSPDAQAIAYGGAAPIVQDAQAAQDSGPGF